jgi:hypothetical protein
MNRDEFTSSAIVKAETDLATRIYTGLTKKEAKKRNVVSR